MTDSEKQTEALVWLASRKRICERKCIELLKQEEHNRESGFNPESQLVKMKKEIIIIEFLRNKVRG